MPIKLQGFTIQQSDLLKLVQATFLILYHNNRKSSEAHCGK